MKPSAVQRIIATDWLADIGHLSNDWKVLAIRQRVGDDDRWVHTCSKADYAAICSSARWDSDDPPTIALVQGTQMFEGLERRCLYARWYQNPDARGRAVA